MTAIERQAERERAAAWQAKVERARGVYGRGASAAIEADRAEDDHRRGEHQRELEREHMDEPNAVNARIMADRAADRYEGLIRGEV